MFDMFDKVISTSSSIFSVFLYSLLMFDYAIRIECIGGSVCVCPKDINIKENGIGGIEGLHAGMEKTSACPRNPHADYPEKPKVGSSVSRGKKW